MFLQQLVTCVRHWRHSEIFKLRFREDSDHVTQSYQFVSIDSVKRRKRRVEDGGEHLVNMVHLDSKLTYPDIDMHLYLFDLLDAISLVAVSHKDLLVRQLALMLM